MIVNIKLDSFIQMCGGGRCPKILINENGDALVQGSLVDDSIKKGMNVPDGEDVVFLPKEVLQEFLESSKNQ